ncbi:hypothetical protein QZH41_014212 [Actinostola sp. cb2023]|nr:hypothetical protein QZH41_014212 [Actinostola sp. cb2023]
MNYNGDYSSEFDEQDGRNVILLLEWFCRTWRDDEFSGVKRKANSTTGLPSKKFMNDEYSRAEGVNQRYHFLALDAYSRHKKMINDYLLFYGPGIEHLKRDNSRDKTDLDVLKQQHRFIWDEEEDSDSTWEKRLAKKYHDKLFKEYCIADLSRYKENKIALRWRIEKEVIEGKGQFFCGNKKCQENEGLKSWEVNFAYEEQGESKNALVKLSKYEYNNTVKPHHTGYIGTNLCGCI